MTRRNAITLILLLTICTGTRLWFSSETNLTFEDSLISFRYAENLADGRGFVYNPGERVLGTTSPLWTILLALARLIGFPDTATNARFLAIFFDILTVIVLTTTFWSMRCSRFSLIWAILFVSSSGIVPITVSGMETSLFLFAMALTISGLTRKTSLLSVGIAITVLTRIDGLVFAIPLLVSAWLKDRKWTLRQMAITMTLLLPWLAFSAVYFADLLPQSLKAKMVAYDFGMSHSARPFIDRFTPLGESTPVRFLTKTISFVVLIAGTARVIRRDHPLLPVVAYFFIYSLLFMSSGGLCFPWYLTPAIFAHDLILAMGFALIIGKAEQWTGKRANALVTGFVAIAIITLNVTTLSGRLDEYREIQGIEEELRTKIGVWLRNNVEPGGSVFLEPIGYIGYHAGPGVRIIDETGIISPRVTTLRRETPTWYIESLRELKPAYIVEYTRSLEENLAEGTSVPLFITTEERAWFYDSYRTVKTFDARSYYPHIDNKEKHYTVLKSRDL